MNLRRSPAVRPTHENIMERPVPGISLHERRERTIQALCEHFASDRLDMTDFETRLDGAHRAGTAEELAALLADLPALRTQSVGTAGVAAAASAALERGGRALGDAVRETRTLVAFMGGVERRGEWTPARRNIVVAVLGGAELDFRDVRLPPGETEVLLVCLMGGAEIIVPPGLNVDANGIAIMGGFAHTAAARSADPAAPVLKLTGFAFMGGVDIAVREPGETAKDARLRERELERSRRRELRDRHGRRDTE
jgi:hypothetical protein